MAVLCGLLAFLMSWLVQPHFRNLGFLTEIVDHPGYRRPHREPVPRTGGMAIFISFFCTLYILERVVIAAPLPWSWLGILSGAGLAILALGVGDDRFGIHAEKKLYGQLLVIVGLMLFGQRLDSVVLPLVGRLDLGGWAWPVTLLWYLGFINSMNLIDGLDGLASGISVMVAVALAVISLAVGEFFSMVFAATLAGSTLAFFYWNIHNRKIFLGDSGSMWMGLVLGTLALNLSQQAGIPLTVLLAPMIVPIWDTGTTIVRRYRKRSSIFQADDRHLHHRLVRVGFSTTSAVLFLLLVTAGAILFALSDFLKAPWLGLPALASWLWSLQLAAMQMRRQRRGLHLDSFSDAVYILGFDDRLDGRLRQTERRLVEIIDLQSQRERVEQQMAAASGGTSAPPRVVDHAAAVAARRRTARAEQAERTARPDRLPRDEGQQVDVLLPTSKDVS